MSSRSQSRTVARGENWRRATSAPRNRKHSASRAAICLPSNDIVAPISKMELLGAKRKEGMYYKKRQSGRTALLIVELIDASTLRAGNDLGMALQPIEITYNGPGDPQDRGESLGAIGPGRRNDTALIGSGYALDVSNKPSLSCVVFRWRSVAGGPTTAANRATGRPCRVRTTSSPASARRTRSVRRALAMLIGTFISCRILLARWLDGKSWSAP